MRRDRRFDAAFPARTGRRNTLRSGRPAKADPESRTEPAYAAARLLRALSGRGPSFRPTPGKTQQRARGRGKRHMKARADPPEVENGQPGGRLHQAEFGELQLPIA